MLCNSCKTLYNVLINSHVIILGLTFWGEVQYKKESLLILDLQRLASL